MSLLAYLAVASFLLWLTRVCHRRIGLVPALLLLGTPLLLTGSALLRDRVVGPIDFAYNTEPLSDHRELLGDGPRTPGILSDIHAQMIPWRAAVRAAWNRGEWPLWNPSLLNGDLLLATSQPAPLSPLSIAELLLPIELSLAFSATLTLFLGGLGGFLFFRAVGASSRGSLLGAIAWSWSGFLLFWLHWPLGRCTALYPWILLAALRLARRPGLRPALALGSILALLLLSGHPETALHVVALASVLALATLRRASWARRRKALLGAFGGGLLAALLAAVFLLPFLVALPESIDFQHRTARAYFDRTAPLDVAAARWLPHLAPTVYGKMGETSGSAPDSWTFPATSYVGSVVFGLGLLGAVRGRCRHRGFLLGSIAVGWTAAVSLPPVTGWIDRLPLFSIAIHERLAFAAAFALAWGAAIGFDRLFPVARAGARDDGARDRRRAALFVAAVALGLAALCGVGSEFGDAFRIPRDFQIEQAVVLVAAALLAVALAAVRASAGVAIAFLLGALLAQRSFEMGHFYPSFPRAAFFPLVDPLTAVPAGGEPHRIVGVGYSWTPNVAAIYGLEDPRGYQAMTFGRLARTRPLWSIPQPVWYNRVDRLDAPFLDFLNVRYALAPRRHPPVAGWRTVAAAGRTKLLENENAAPRFFVPRLVRVARTAGPLEPEIAAETNPVRRVRIEPIAPAFAVPEEPYEIRNPRGRMEIRPRGSGYELLVDLSREAWVASSITAWSGWRVESEGRELPLAYANHAFLGFLAPAGHSRIQVFYRPRSFEVGVALSTLGLICLAAGAAWRPRHGGERGSGPRARRV